MINANHSRPNRMFWAALLLSALIHVIGVIYMRLSVPPQLMQGKVALSVILAQPKKVGRSMNPSALPPIVKPVIRKSVDEPHIPEVKPIKPQEKEAELMDDEPVLEPMLNQDTGETLQEVPADPVKPGQQVVEAAKIRVVLLVSGNGAVQQIIWGTLPVITNEVLQHLERQLRMKSYIATGKSYTISEIVEMPNEVTRTAPEPD